MDTPEDLRRGFGVIKGGRQGSAKICGGVQVQRRAKVPISAKTWREAEILAIALEDAKARAAEARKRLRERLKRPPPICGGAS